MDSAVLTTNNGADHSRRLYAYGRKRYGTTDTLYRYGGHMDDGTGLIYMNARYYDPQMGLFISPDSIIPDPSNVLDYNRYAYARGNPIGNNDPSGHATCGLTMMCHHDNMDAGGLRALARTAYGVALAGGINFANNIASNMPAGIEQLPGMVDHWLYSGNNAAQNASNLPPGGNAAGPGGFDPNDFNGIEGAFRRIFGQVPGAQSVINGFQQGGNAATGASWQARYALQHLKPADVVAFEQRQGGGIVDIVTTQGSRISFIEAKVINNWYALENSGFSPNVAQKWLEQVYKQNPQMVYTRIVVEANARLPQSFIQFFEQEGIRVESYLR